MKAIELKLARELIGLSVSEAAEHIGNVSRRSWEYWESGGRAVPEDVASVIKQLVERHRQIIRMALEQGIEKMNVIYYATPDYCESILDWRFSQSLARTLALDFGANFVLFDKTQFDTFCKEKGLKDSKETRSYWAATEKS